MANTAPADQRALANRLASLYVSVQLCRGNNQSGWLSEGGYDLVAEMLFNDIHADSYFLEYDTARVVTFEPLRLVPKHKTVVLTSGSALGIVNERRSRVCCGLISG